MKFRPCIDLHEGRVKQIIGSTLEGEKLVTNFDTMRSPSSYADMYKRDGLTGGHVIMLGEGNRKAAKEALRAFPGGMQIGGGINPDNAAEYLDSGASHVIVTSYIIDNGKINRENLQKISGKTGRKRLVLDLSCVKTGEEYFIASGRWKDISQTKITGKLLEELAEYCDEFLIHAVDNEGKRGGVDTTLVGLLSEKSPVRATYAGGVSSMEDVKMVSDAGKDMVDITVGSALDIFGGDLKYSALVHWNRMHCKVS